MAARLNEETRSRKALMREMQIAYVDKIVEVEKIVYLDQVRVRVTIFSTSTILSTYAGHGEGEG